MNNDFVALRCPNCGGKIEVQQAKIEEDFIESPNGFTYIGSTTGEKIRCAHCGTEFQRRQTVELHFEGKGHLRVNTGGGAFISGNINTNGGDFVGRNRKTTVVVSKVNKR